MKREQIFVIKAFDGDAVLTLLAPLLFSGEFLVLHEVADDEVTSMRPDNMKRDR